MSLLMLKTKNLSWQDHTLNIEAMLAPLRSTLLMNKHKTLDTKFDQEKALYERQRDACIKDFVVEKRLIERRRQKIINRKKEIMQEIRSHSALEHADEKKSKTPRPADNKERSFSAPSDGRLRGEPEGVANITNALPRLTLKHTPLFGGTLLRPRMFLETGITTSTSPSPSAPPIDSESRELNAENKASNIFITGDGQRGIIPSTPSAGRHRNKTPSSGTTSRNSSYPLQQHTGGAYFSKPPKPPDHQSTPPQTSDTTTKKLTKESPTTGRSTHRSTGTNKRIPNVTFLGLLNNEVDDESNDGDGRITVEVKQKTVEDKVRDFLKELDAFNSRPPTAVGEDDDIISVFSSVRSRDISKTPLVANRYQTLTLDKKLLEKAFDRYIERRSHQDLLKAMKLAAKMKAHIRQARNTSLVPTMAVVKSSKTFLKLLKRQQRREKQNMPVQ